MYWEFSEKGIVFFPDPHLVGNPGDYGLEYEEVYFEAADGVRLHGWWVPQAGAPVLLWFHGNAGNISHRLENLKLLHELAEVQVFIFDYREYGKSQGRISREGTFKDSAGAYRYVAETRGMPAARPGPLRPFPGHRPGHGPGRPPPLPLPDPRVGLHQLLGHGQTLRCPSCSIGGPGSPMTIWGKLIRLKAPLLIIHGSEDEIIPVEMSRRLFAAARDPKELYIIPGAHHNDTYLVGGPAYFERLTGLLDGSFIDRRRNSDRHRP